MKALPKKLLPLTLFAIAVTSLFSVQPAQGFTVTLKQVGSNVVATGNGPINLTGLTLTPGFVSGSAVIANYPAVFIGPAAGGFVNIYEGFTGPSNFGSGGIVN